MFKTVNSVMLNRGLKVAHPEAVMLIEERRIIYP